MRYEFLELGGELLEVGVVIVKGKSLGFWLWTVSKLGLKLSGEHPLEPRVDSVEEARVRHVRAQWSCVSCMTLSQPLPHSVPSRKTLRLHSWSDILCPSKSKKAQFLELKPLRCRFGF